MLQEGSFRLRNRKCQTKGEHTSQGHVTLKNHTKLHYAQVLKFGKESWGIRKCHPQIFFPQRQSLNLPNCTYLRFACQQVGINCSIQWSAWICCCLSVWNSPSFGRQWGIWQESWISHAPFLPIEGLTTLLKSRMKWALVLPIAWKWHMVALEL